MLADLTLVGCYNSSTMSHKDRDIILLASAKENLRRMAFYGLCESQKVSQYLFENTFHLHFKQSFVQFNETHSSLTKHHLNTQLVNKIRQLNHLDVQLYEYAKELLMQRFNKMKEADKNFEYNFSNLGVITRNTNSNTATSSPILIKTHSFAANDYEESSEDLVSDFI
jgi:heparan sulfate 6-O-sulfotransferase HS6ST1